MVTGLRDFRNKLSAYTALLRRGQTIIITDRNKPIASYISPEKLRELAKKANDISILSQLMEAETDKNRDFIGIKSLQEKEIEYYLKEAEKGKGHVPDNVITKLRTILSALENLVSDAGNLEDQRILSSLVQKSRDPISRVLDYDYYHVHQEFIDKVSTETKTIIEITTSSDVKSNRSKDLKLLADMIENAVIREKNDGDDQVSPTLCSILVRLTHDNKYHSSRIYTIMPNWYEPRKFNYFLDRLSPLANKLLGQKVGYRFTYQRFRYEILSIS